ncbi:hypothetical protein PAB09_06165 [Corynebacterium sp. SCR221107]|uniref:hypothetical protein n=1 Tax=Corynebacterium sp. SCR221107 TaxID=3017361 RepID=UPI0022EC5B44|nr:hypothetical protein [Corynebacterium sp. SCR221107]WBT09868.1 hypothetical protein PAB09_06165 [Corynebacterium sp. SCR221107]
MTNDQSPGAVTVTEFQQRMYEEMLVHHEIGGTFTTNGTPTTLCTYGDGYGLNVITAGANTSCDFAREVSHALTRSLLPRTVTATSPVTGQSYTMSCSNDANNLITCTGGNNATVYMY